MSIAMYGGLKNGKLASLVRYGRSTTLSFAL